MLALYCLGLDDATLEHVDSPFDYHENSLLYVELPRAQRTRGEAAIIDGLLVHLIRAAGGRTVFAVFTNRR